MDRSNLPPRIPFEESELSGSLNDRIAKVKQFIPAEHVAYHDPDIELTYGQLFERSERLAAALAARLGAELPQSQQLVAMLLDADWTELVGYLGVILSGHYYLAFDPLQGLAHPEASFREYPIKALITTRRHAEAARDLAQLAPHEVAILFMDEIPDAPADFPKPAITADSYHSIYLTTGSTGKPRGVVRNHAARVYAAYQEATGFDLNSADRVTLTMPVSLGMSLAGSLTALLNGASVHRRLAALANPAAMYRWMAEEKITVLHGSAGLIRSLTKLPAEYGLIESLRYVKTGGEPMTRSEIERLLSYMPEGGKFSSRLASNEGGTFGMFTAQAGVEWVGETNPAGVIPEFVSVSVVDENRKPVPFGETGELVVRSRFMAVGYYNDPEQTAARFEQTGDGSGERMYYTGDMGRIFPDRRVEFLGRRDFRVKVRGYTVELEAVDRALRKLEHVRDAATVVQTLPNGNKRLVGFLVLEEGRELSIEQARGQLGKDLLQYMIPSVLQIIDAIPRIGIGKIDRKALPVPAPQRDMLSEPYRPPQTERETELTRIWEAVLGIRPVGVDDSFFELGGDSLLSMQMNMEVEKHFNLAVPPQFYRRPTIARLAEILESLSASNQAETSGSPAPVKELEPEPSGLHKIRKQIGKLTPERIFSLLRRQVEKNMLSKPYDQGLAWVMEWAGKPMTQNLLYSREKELYKRLWQDLGRDLAGFEESFSLVLAGNIISDHLISAVHRQKRRSELKRFGESPYLFWRSFGQIMGQPESSLGRKFAAIRGLENLQAAVAQGQGVLALSFHGSLTRLPLLMMTSLLGKPAALVLSPRVSMREELGSGAFMVRDYSTVSGDKQAQYSADIIMQGYRALQNKEVVVAFVDNGYTSRGEWPLNICGRRYMMRTGWADLASRTGAQIVPMRASLSKDGQALIEFLPAFKSPAGPVDHETHLQAYMSQFADYFGSVIMEHPEALLWSLMRNHLDMPQVNEPELKTA